MFRFGETNITKEKFYAAKKLINVWDVNVDNIVIWKLIETKTNSKYLIRYLENATRPLVLITPKMPKVKDGDKDTNNRLMPFRIDDEKLLEKCKAIWTEIEYSKNIELNALPVCDDRYIKTKIRIYGDFCGLNVPEDDQECESFTVISIDSLLVYENKYYLQVYFDNCVIKLQTKK